MLTSSFLRSTKSVLDLIENSQVLSRLLVILDATSIEVQPTIGLLIKNNEGVPKAGAVLRQQLQDLRAKLQECKPRLVFESISNFRQGVSEAEISKSGASLDEFLKRLWRFQESYEAYIDQYSPESALLLVNLGEKLYRELLGLHAGLRAAADSLAESYELSPDQEEMELQLADSNDVKDFSERLGALSKAYEEACILLKVSTIEFPLRIVKIESGSLFARIFGNKESISLIKNGIREVAKYLYRNRTREGKIESLRLGSAAIENLLDLRTRLKEHGIDTKEIDDGIKKSSIVIAQNLAQLLDGQQEVTIDGEFVRVSDESDSPKRLAHQNSSDGNCAESNHG